MISSKQDKSSAHNSCDKLNGVSSSGVLD